MEIVLVPCSTLDQRADMLTKALGVRVICFRDPCDRGSRPAYVQRRSDKRHRIWEFDTVTDIPLSTLPLGTSTVVLSVAGTMGLVPLIV
eukprot:2008332-Rhodomonas_salina.1